MRKAILTGYGIGASYLIHPIRWLPPYRLGKDCKCTDLASAQRRRTVLSEGDLCAGSMVLIQRQPSASMILNYRRLSQLEERHLEASTF